MFIIFLKIAPKISTNCSFKEIFIWKLDFMGLFLKSHFFGHRWQLLVECYCELNNLLKFQSTKKIKGFISILWNFLENVLTKNPKIVYWFIWNAFILAGVSKRWTLDSKCQFIHCNFQIYYTVINLNQNYICDKKSIHICGKTFKWNWWWNCWVAIAI